MERRRSARAPAAVAAAGRIVEANLPAPPERVSLADAISFTCPISHRRHEVATRIFGG